MSYDSGSLTHTVNDAEATPTNVAPTAGDADNDPTGRIVTKPTPCYTADPDTAGNFTRAAKGAMCQVDRKGVFNFVVGVRVKF